MMYLICGTAGDSDDPAPACRVQAGISWKLFCIGSSVVFGTICHCRKHMMYSNGIRVTGMYSVRGKSRTVTSESLMRACKPAGPRPRANREESHQPRCTSHNQPIKRGAAPAAGVEARAQLQEPPPRAAQPLGARRRLAGSSCGRARAAAPRRGGVRCENGDPRVDVGAEHLQQSGHVPH